MESIVCKIDQHGRLMIPAEWRQRYGIQGGSEVILRVEEDGRLRLETRKQRVSAAQALVRRYIRPGRSLVDELIRERRAEARRERRR